MMTCMEACEDKSAVEFSSKGEKGDSDESGEVSSDSTEMLQCDKSILHANHPSVPGSQNIKRTYENNSKTSTSGGYVDGCASVAVKNKLSDKKQAIIHEQVSFLNRNTKTRGGFQDNKVIGDVDKRKSTHDATKATRHQEDMGVHGKKNVKKRPMRSAWRDGCTVEVTPPSEECSNCYTRLSVSDVDEKEERLGPRPRMRSTSRTKQKDSIVEGSGREASKKNASKDHGRGRLWKLQRLARYLNELEETAILSDDHEVLVDSKKDENAERNEKSVYNFLAAGDETIIASEKKYDSNDDKNYSKYIKKPVASNHNSSNRRKMKNQPKNEKSCQTTRQDEIEEENPLKRINTAPECKKMERETSPVRFYLEDHSTEKDMKVSISPKGKETSKREASILCDKEKFVETTNGIFNRKKRKSLKKCNSLRQTPPSLKRTITQTSFKNVKKEPSLQWDRFKNKSLKIAKNSSFHEKSKNLTGATRELSKLSDTKIDILSKSISKPLIELKKSNSIKEEKSKQLYLNASLKTRPASVIGLKSLQDMSLRDDKFSSTVSYLMKQTIKNNMANPVSKGETGKAFEHEISPETANLLFRDQALLDFEDNDFNDKIHDPKVTVPIYVCLIIIVSYIFTGAMLFRIWEDWDYIASSYFCFITLSTIGFGDIVPGTDMNSWASNVKLVLCTLWLAFGLSLLAMCFNLMQEGVKDKCRMIGKKVGLLKKEDDKT